MTRLCLQLWWDPILYNRIEGTDMQKGDLRVRLDAEYVKALLAQQWTADPVSWNMLFPQESGKQSAWKQLCERWIHL